MIKIAQERCDLSYYAYPNSHRAWREDPFAERCDGYAAIGKHYYESGFWLKTTAMIDVNRAAKLAVDII